MTEALRWSPSTPLWIARLQAEVRQLATPLLLRKTSGLLSLRLEVPLPADLPFPDELQPALLWQQPAKDRRMLAIGKAHWQEFGGADRFADLQLAHAGLLASWTRVQQGAGSSQAMAWVGYAFADQGASFIWQEFPNALLWVPELLLDWRDGCCTLWLSCDCDGAKPEQVFARWFSLLVALMQPRALVSLQSMAELHTSPSAEDWRTQLAQLSQAIARGQVSKVVLSRHRQLQIRGGLDINLMLQGLAEQYADCTLISMRINDSLLLSATPESLVALHQGRVCSDALAGTLAPDAGQDCQAMLEYEHRPVVEAIAHALRPLCTELDWPQQPSLMPVGQIQHLWTPFRGRVRPGVGLMQLISALHPTPAVGGSPRPAALDWIAAQEGASRGWYTGGLGWLGEQSGEVAVVLRCLLWRANQVHLFAGAGIQACSDADAELVEIEHKFGALQDKLRTFAH